MKLNHIRRIAAALAIAVATMAPTVDGSQRTSDLCNGACADRAEAACGNLGIAALPGYICREELRAGPLRQILPGWIAADARISALIPYRRGLLSAVRALVDFFAEEVPKVTAFGPT